MISWLCLDHCRINWERLISSLTWLFTHLWLTLSTPQFPTKALSFPCYSIWPHLNIIPLLTHHDTARGEHCPLNALCMKTPVIIVSCRPHTSIMQDLLPTGSFKCKRFPHVERDRINVSAQLDKCYAICLPPSIWTFAEVSETKLYNDRLLLLNSTKSLNLIEGKGCPEKNISYQGQDLIMNVKQARYKDHSTEISEGNLILNNCYILFKWTSAVTQKRFWLRQR